MDELPTAELGVPVEGCLGGSWGYGHGLGHSQDRGWGGGHGHGHDHGWGQSCSHSQGWWTGSELSIMDLWLRLREHNRVKDEH